MKKIALAALVAAALVPSLGRAQVYVQLPIPSIRLALPSRIAFEMVAPGIHLAAGAPEQVYYTDGAYWAHRDAHWYRAMSPRAPFQYVEPRWVPAALWAPPGHLRHDDWRAERRFWKEQRKAERHAWKEWRHGRGHGHGHDDD